MTASKARNARVYVPGKSRCCFARLLLSGSSATGTDDAESDLDFLVTFRPLPEGSYADAYFGLMEGLEALFQRPIDLVVASAIRNRYFRQSVDQTKTLLYAA